MFTTFKDKVLWTTGAAGLITLAVGWWADNAWLAGIGAAAVCYFGLRAYGWAPRLRRSASSLDDDGAADLATLPLPRAAVDPTDTLALVEEMLTQGRSALLLRPQLVGNLSADQSAKAREFLGESMALVPQGEVELDSLELSLGKDESQFDEDEDRRQVVRVPGLFLDRYPVTNRQYLEFVRSGGYEQMSFWDQHIWPAVLDFVDSTGSPGPRAWKNGQYPRGADDHPVTGVSWYEAAAYARWVGKRLPTEAEWVKAGCWPVPLDEGTRVQRKYPWGESMDRSRCNLWGTGPGHIVAVDEYAEGVSVGGIHQLIGNVWEWTTGNFGAGGDPTLTLPNPMKSIRGGAFDTYFDNQATCQFRSGENPVARKHNIGFRCAVSFCDVSIVATPQSKIAEADLTPEVSIERGARDSMDDSSLATHDSVLQEATP